MFKSSNRSTIRAGANAVHVAERPAAEGREPDPEHRPDVAVTRRTQNAFLEAPRRLVDHRQHAALDDLLAIQLPTLRRR